MNYDLPSAAVYNLYNQHLCVLTLLCFHGTLAMCF